MKGQHSNVKPEEPESITGKVGEANNVDFPAPQVTEVTPERECFESRARLERPDYKTTPMTKLKPVIAASLKQEALSLSTKSVDSEEEIPIGESCKNGGCKEVLSLDL